MIKIFSLDKIIYLINDKTLFKSGEKSILREVGSIDEMQIFYDELIHKDDLHQLYFFNENKEQLFSYFTSMFRIINAAGGLVTNAKGEWLFIFRNGKWDLPKGKIETNEGIEKAAIREVEEECGIKKLKILNELPSTYHTYFLEEKAILKRTYWFRMSGSDSSKLTPQLEEGITEVKWIATKDLESVRKNTYESILEVISEL